MVTRTIIRVISSRINNLINSRIKWHNSINLMVAISNLTEVFSRNIQRNLVLMRRHLLIQLGNYML